MKKIPNNVVADLLRHLPFIIKSIPPNQNTRLDNAIRITKKHINKLKNLKDE